MTQLGGATSVNPAATPGTSTASTTSTHHRPDHPAAMDKGDEMDMWVRALHQMKDIIRMLSATDDMDDLSLFSLFVQN